MLKLKIHTSLYLNVLAVIIISALLVSGCGKKDDAQKNEASGDKTEQKTEGSNEQKTDEQKIENINENTPIHYVLESTGEIVGVYDIYSKGKNIKATMNVTIHGQKSGTEMYSDGKTMYIITEMGGKKTGMKMDPTKFNEQNDKKKEFNPMNFREGCKDCEKVGGEPVLGKQTTIYQDKNGIRYSVYNETIPLKIVMPKTTMEAKQLDLNASFGDDIFTVPKDIDYIEMDKMMDMKDMKDGKNLKEEMKKMEDVMKNYKK